MPMNEQNNLSQWIKRRRKQLDLTQTALADLVGCSVTSIRKFENGTRRPSKQIAELLADVLAIPTEDRAAFLAAARGTELPPSLHSPTNLPAQSLPFVGRQHEIEQLLLRLEDPRCRLLTLVGPGGIGKTRLAIEAARRLQSRFKDGVHFAALASLNSAEFIEPTIAQAIGLSFLEQENAQAQLVDYLRDKHMLLVLDNFEHLLEGARLLSTILAQAHHVKLIVTSWEQLKLREEWVIQVQGLRFPKDDFVADNLDVLTDQNDAIELFIQIAERTQPTFDVKHQIASIIRICKWVEGMPLGIELAAGWLSTMSCSQIAAHIAKDLDFLQATSRNELRRHQSLRAVFDRTWNLLTDLDRAVFMRLSIFRGDFSLEAAQSVAQASLPILRNLVEKSLVHSSHESRYTIHEFLRQYAYKQLEASDEFPITRTRFVAFFTSLAQQAEEPLKTSERMIWVRKLNAEINHLRIIRQWCETGDVSLDDEMILLGSLWIYWSWNYRNMGEVGSWCDQALSRAGSIANIKSLTACYTIGSTAYLQGRYEYGLPIVSDAASLSRERGDRRTLGYLLAGTGITLATVGNPTAALPVLEESISITREMGEEWFLPIPLTGLGNTLLAVGDVERSSNVFAEALHIAGKHGHLWEIGIVLYFASHCSLVQGDYDKARRQIERAIALQRNTDHLWSLANLLNALGHILRVQGELKQAYNAFEESLDHYQFLGNKRNVAYLLISLGKLAFTEQNYEESRELILSGVKLCQQIEHTGGLKSGLAALADHLILQERFEQAAFLLGASESLVNSLDDPLHAQVLFDTPYDYALSRQRLVEVGCSAVWQDGANMSVEQIMKMETLFDSHH
jgi:predicted ATPase/DNA-binding XRE family transcriptional regulator